MTEPLVAVERGDDGVAVVRLQNGKVNSLSSELLRQLRAAAEDLTADSAGGRRRHRQRADLRGRRRHLRVRRPREGPRDRHAVPRGAERRRRHPAHGHRRRLGARPRRRLRAGAGLRPAHRRRQRPLRTARDPARHHPRWWRHPAARSPGRAGQGQGPRAERPPVRADEALAHRPGRRGRARRRAARPRAGARPRSWPRERSPPRPWPSGRSTRASTSRSPTGSPSSRTSSRRSSPPTTPSSGCASFLENGPGKATFTGH